MISWALRRNSTAQDAPGLDDTTILDQPDTPAPVFAVRALKSALFGTPAPRERASKKTTQPVVIPAPAAQGPAPASPTKPPGILLTPGTGAARRKRVSFGYGVKEGASVPDLELSDEAAEKVLGPWAADGDANKTGDSANRPKTRLTQAMENATKNKKPGAGADAREAEDRWEELEEESDFDVDVTVDLNEPHSRSGKYWKAYFESYHDDAKAEMEKLVKYKQLAKSYAKKKDEEAVDLNQKLKEEQERVKQMEAKVAEVSREVALRAQRSGGQYDAGLVEELTKQTTIALEYKKQVEELESLLLENAEHDEDNASRQRRIASPRTQKTLLDAQRELRKARAQARELERAQEERDRLRSELKFAEQRSSKLVEENKKLSGFITQSASRTQDLENSLIEAKSEAQRKDDELKRLRKDYEKLKEDAKARYSEALQVQQKKNEKIAELQGELVALRAEGAESRWTSRARNLETKLKAGSEKVYTAALDRESAAKFLETAEEESTQLLRELGELRKVSVQRGLIPASNTPGIKLRSKSNVAERRKSEPLHDDALVSSRALREKIEAEMGRRDPHVLSERGNFQDSRSSASSGRSAHLREPSPPPPPNRQPSRASRGPDPVATTTTGTSASRAKQTIDDILGNRHNGDQRRRVSPVETRRPATTRPFATDREPLQVDLLQDSFAPLGGPVDAHASSVWDMSTVRTTLPADRKAAAIARLQRKRSERAKEERNKENAQPF
ncbi:spindle pole body formation-associated protein-domain-containing protein [Schizothecium vesticola]|uniref:Spindle pole body formation-associated protein-domain-containing protein n=1 Tax=Schizothecium vesticola TaxID=314040 RepID=A0AA40FAZ9_9PEZI|nr:spindle pole body formation-associated protein-domain-containing protein [Schizothecium vesticola]